MDKAMECRPLTQFPRSAGTTWLQTLVNRLLDRAAGRPTPLRPETVSGYLLRDIGLDSSDSGPQRSRSAMDWPLR